MKTLFLFGLVAFAAANDYYDLPEMDFVALAENEEEFKTFKDCILNKGPCSAIYQDHKAYIPESTIQACKKCTVIQKHFGYKFFEKIKSTYPEDYALFKKTYDPENKYLEAFEAELYKYKTV